MGIGQAVDWTEEKGAAGSGAVAVVGRRREGLCAYLVGPESEDWVERPSTEFDTQQEARAGSAIGGADAQYIWAECPPIETEACCHAGCKPARSCF